MHPVLFCVILALLLNGCANLGRYQQKHDSIPTLKPNEAQLQDAIPRLEKKSPGGNKDYQVWGKDYQVLDSSENFTESGVASWYGEKFHGHLTSNGEIYDMYGMSAAHKNLPLPTYLKVTNIENNKSVIVRVNDRGPFHENRIIDLSYSAAYKLDMLSTGTANVIITSVVTNDGHQLASVTPSTAVEVPYRSEVISNYYIQVFATQSLSSARDTANLLKTKFKEDVIYPYQAGIFRVFIGPIPSNTVEQPLLEKLHMLGYQNAYKKDKIH